MGANMENARKVEARRSTKAGRLNIDAGIAITDTLAATLGHLSLYKVLTSRTCFELRLR